MLEPIFNLFIAGFVLATVLWIILAPFYLIGTPESFIPYVDKWLGKPKTNGELVLKLIAVWLLPIAIILAIPKLKEWLKQTR